MRNALNLIFLLVYLGLIVYGLTEVISGLMSTHPHTMQPVLAMGLIVAGVVGLVDVIRDFGNYH